GRQPHASRAARIGPNQGQGRYGDLPRSACIEAAGTLVRHCLNRAYGSRRRKAATATELNCCARAASGHAAAAPPSSMMNSRRFIASPSSRPPHGTHPTERQDTIASCVAVTLIGHPLSNKRTSLL